jgi:hypothetical protein
MRREFEIPVVHLRPILIVETVMLDVPKKGTVAEVQCRSLCRYSQTLHVSAQANETQS